MSELHVGIGPAAGGAVGVLPIGPLHPSAHGGLRLHLRVRDGRVVEVEPEVGFMHRGAEKLFEARDYRSIIVLANRHEWLSAFANELGIVLAAERLLGMEVPERAVWARTALAELNRVLNALMFLASPPDPRHPEGATRSALAVLALREPLQQVMEEVSGGRLHFMLNRVGGLKEELPTGWAARAATVVRLLAPRFEAAADAVVGDPALRARLRGLGVLSRADALGYGTSGPVARGSGVDGDLRTDAPYLAYGRLAVPRVAREEGDALARWEVLVASARDALGLALTCLEHLVELGPGEVALRLPKAVTLPEGTAYVATENPLGLNGYYLVSRGLKVPWRLKLRSASFGNVQALEALLPGTPVAELVPVLTSVFFVSGDVDR